MALEIRISKSVNEEVKEKAFYVKGALCIISERLKEVVMAETISMDVAMVMDSW